MGDTNLLTVQANMASGAHAPYHLYASSATRAMLGGLADAVPGWTGMDVMLITNKDAYTSINHVLDQQQVKGDIPAALSLAFNDMARGLGYDHPISDRHNGERETTRTRLIQASAMATVTNVPSTRPMNTDDPLNPRSNLCVISVPERLDASDLSISRWTHMPGSEDTFDLTTAQVATFVLAHETGHCGQDFLAAITPDKIPKFEAEADQHGLNILRQLMGGDTGQFRKAAQELTDLRVLETFHNFDINHATTPALNVDGPVANLGALDTDGVAKPTLDGRGTSPQTIGLMAVLSKVVDLVTQTAHTDKADATKLLATDPNLIHESVQFLNAQGAFQASPLQTTYVDQYLTAFSRHGSTFGEQLLPSTPAIPQAPLAESQTTASVPSMRP
jgi:hypothetical protein